MHSLRVRGAVLYEAGLPRPYRKSRPLQIVDLELSGPGPGEVLVKVAAAGLCHSDLSVVNGSRPRPLPMLLGHEGSGEVVETGPGVTRVKTGDHVVFSFVPMCGHCDQCLGGRPYMCSRGQAANREGVLLRGGVRFQDSAGRPIYHHLGVSAFAQYTVVDEASLTVIDPQIPLDKAALFGCAVMTGAGAVVNTADIEMGAKVVVFGMGGVGLSAVMAARARGAWPVIAVDVLDAKLELAMEVGATHTVNRRSDAWLAVIENLTGGGADYAFEAVGEASVLVDALKVTRPGGTTVGIGLPEPTSEVTLPALAFAGEGKSVLGSYMGSSVPVRDLPRLTTLYREGRLPIDRLVSRTIGLDDLNEALDRLDQGEVARQVLLF